MGNLILHVQTIASLACDFRFSVELELNQFRKLYNITTILGATHTDELCYLFRYVSHSIFVFK